MSSRHRIAFGIAGWALVAAGIAGCAADDATAPASPPTLATAPLASVTSGSAGRPGATSSDASVATSDAAPTSVSSVPEPVSIAPPPVATEAVGVPGGASETPMCQDYARVVGTQSVLTIAGAFGGLAPDALARLELIAAPTVIAAAAALDDAWPAELQSEQPAVAGGVIGPIRNRAERANAALLAAGIDPVPLQDLWLDVLARYDPAAPALTVPALDGAAESLLVTAAESYAATEPRYDLDPNVLRSVPTPLTNAYLFERCPELSYLIAGDAD